MRPSVSPLNVAIVTKDTYYMTNPEPIIESMGHTATTIDDAGIAAYDFSAFDVILTARMDPTYSADIVAKLRAENITNNKPLIVGLDAYSVTIPAGTGAVSAPATDLGLVTGVDAISAQVTKMNVTDASHYITRVAGATGDFPMFDTAEFGGGAIAPWIGTALADADDTSSDMGSGRAQVIAVETGTSFLDSGTTGARIAMMHTYMRYQTPTDEYKEMLSAALDWVAGNDSSDTVARLSTMAASALYADGISEASIITFGGSALYMPDAAPASNKRAIGVIL